MLTLNDVITGVPGKVCAIVIAFSSVVWAHGTWVSGVNATIAETGNAMKSIDKRVQIQEQQIANIDSQVVRIDADVESLKEDQQRTEAVANELSRHVGDLREITAELRALSSQMNRRRR